ALLTAATKQFISFAPYMAIGVAVGAFLHGYVPQSFFESISSLASWWLIPAAAIIGVFLYVRASTMVPIATSLIAKGMSMGAIMSLTIAGAGASLPEMIMMKRMFHWPLIIAFILLVFTTACLTGFAIDLL
ncbi:MAG: permease, partial [Kangiellaceae bacterium]|nr:permease [Kangiellaceae bacterium]